MNIRAVKNEGKMSADRGVEKEMLRLGQMVFDAAQSVLLIPEQFAHTERTLTFPDTNGRRHEIALLVCSPMLALVINEFLQDAGIPRHQGDLRRQLRYAALAVVKGVK